MTPAPVVIWLTEEEIPASPEKRAEFLAVVTALRQAGSLPVARPRRRTWLRWPRRAARPAASSESALHDAASEFTAVWQHLLASLPDSYGCYMTCTEAEAAADLFRAAGDDATAAEIIAAHARYDQRGDLHFTAPAPAAGPAGPASGEDDGQVLDAAAGGPMADEDVLAALAELWADSGCQRLEISRQGDSGRYGGYCIRDSGIEDQAADLVARGNIIGRRLAALLDASGWQRLEAVATVPGRVEQGCGGWCERADGSGLSWNSGDLREADDAPRPAVKDPWM